MFGAARSTFANHLGDVFRAGRIAKNVPMLALLLSGALTSTKPLSPLALGISAGALFLTSLFISHLNVLADEELDRIDKPHLSRWLRAGWPLGAYVMTAELGGALLLMGWYVLRGAVQGAVWLACALACATLYSFNFFMPWKGFVSRFKTVWSGHLTVSVGGYVAVWQAGAACGLGVTWTEHVALLPVFVLTALSNYALLVAECAGDAEAERRRGLRSFAAILGTRRARKLAAAMEGLVVMATLLAFVFMPGRWLFVCFLPMMLADGFGIARSFRQHAPSSQHAGMDFYDHVSNLGRLSTAALLALRFLHSSQ